MHEEEDHSPNPEELPIFQKGLEIYELTLKITDLIPNEEQMLCTYKDFMLEDAAILTVKIAGAEAADLYDIRMESAAVIRKAARDLMSHCSGLQLSGFKETQYLHLIREAIEEYRLLFIDWVKTFDPWNYTVDRWGLFNPPGVNADDHNPDDDIM